MSASSLLPATNRFGDAPHLGGDRLTGAATGMARTPNGRGYWVVDAAGSVVAHGQARLYGQVAPGGLGSPVVGIAATPSGAGYWLVTKAGGVQPFGDAGSFGSLEGQTLPAPIVGIAPSAHGHGYYLAGADGRVYAFGKAHGGRSGVHLAKPVVAIASTSDDRGYWLAGAEGGVSAYGDRGLAEGGGGGGGGSLPAKGVRTTDVVAIAPSPSSQGYWLVEATGTVHGFGNAPVVGSTAPNPADRATVALLSDRDGRGYWELSTHVTPPPPPPPRAPAPTGPSGTALGSFSVTCYSGAGFTASGAPTSLSDVAVDPSVIPLGSTIYISNVGTRTAQDTGSAIIGNRLDIWEPTLNQCINWGRQDEQVWLQS